MKIIAITVATFLAVTAATSIFSIPVGILLSTPLSAQDKAIRQERTERQKDRRMALVIGNSDYNFLHWMTPEAGATNADSMAAALGVCGFTVLKHTNASHEEMSKVLSAFGDSIKRGGVGLFYFSGAGNRRDNSLWPVVGDYIKNFKVRWVLDAMETAGNRTNIVILDVSAQKAMDFLPSGVFVAYAGGLLQNPTKYTSFDTKHTYFTEALLNVMHEPGLKIEEVFKRVRTKVANDTAGRVVPWTASTLTEDFYFVRPLEAASPPLTPPP